MVAHILLDIVVSKNFSLHIFQSILAILQSLYVLNFLLLTQIYC